jgi:hypothetical protein
MLGFKFAHVEILKLKHQEQKHLEAERESLISELHSSLSPELALQAVAIVTSHKPAKFRGSSWMKRLSSIVAPKVPRLVPVVGEEANEERSFSSVVRRLGASSTPVLPTARAYFDWG